ncbi:MAG TPA: hypothetical protein VFR24_27560 [Candidatus Angelobacter sp.]|nr:hypothetical protein [Candidatus Angelobacter sp.]
MAHTVSVDAALFSSMVWALNDFKFKLCRSPVWDFDGRIDVWQAMEKRRLAQFEAVKKILAEMVPPAQCKPWSEVEKAFN